MFDTSQVMIQYSPWRGKNSNSTIKDFEDRFLFMARSRRAALCTEKHVFQLKFKLSIVDSSRKIIYHQDNQSQLQNSEALAS